MIHFRVRYERLRDRLGTVRRRAGLVRAAWLALLVPLAGLGLHIAGVGPLSPLWWALGAALAFGVAAGRLARAAPPRALDRELDRRFGLDELLVTAVEVDQRGPRGAIEARLLDDAATAVAVLGGERAIDDRTARREAETCVALALVLAGLWLLAGTLGGLPEVGRLPALGAMGGSSDGADGEGSGPGEGAGPGAGAGGSGVPAALGVMSGALGDHAAARDMADALAAGDPAAAARAARALADRAEGLSAEGRADLAATLQSLARRMAEDHPTLSRALREAGAALEDPDDVSPAGGIERLAAALDALSLSGGSGMRLAPDAAARAREGPPAERLVVEPPAAALEVGGEAPGRGAAEPRTTGRLADPERAGEAPAATTVEARPPAATGGSAAAGIARDAGGLAGADPLRYPWGWREMVRRYFQAPGDGG